jgi:hypothetical protein
MKRRHKILFGGLSLAAAIILTLVIGRGFYAHRLSGLVAECVATDVKESELPADTSSPIYMRELRRFGDKRVCDPMEIADRQGGVSVTSDLQWRVLAAYYDQKSFMSDFPTIAGCIALLSALPWLWYFFLQRLREVGRALRGTDDK